MKLNSLPNARFIRAAHLERIEHNVRQRAVNLSQTHHGSSESTNRGQPHHPASILLSAAFAPRPGKSRSDARHTLCVAARLPDLGPVCASEYCLTGVLAGLIL